jgi:Domain of unknown function (DUF4380)
LRTITELPITSSPCRVTKENYLGWTAVRLANGILELLVVPEIGGRVIQLRIGGSDLLYVNRRHAGRVYRSEENNFDAGWKNYGGSKVWPAPQGWSSDAEWPGPPDPVLDGGIYSCQVLEESQQTAAVHLESPPDEYTGLTFSRAIRIFQDSATVEVRHAMRNTSARPVRWSIWQVTQLAANSNVAVFVPARAYRQMFGDRPYNDINFDPELKLCRLGYSDHVAKLAMKPEQGWMAALDSRRGVALVETFPLFPALVYPDDASVELWVNGRGSFTIHGKTFDMGQNPNGCDPFIETEVLSPLVELDPGDEYCFRTCWHCTSIKANTIGSFNNCSATGRPLMAKRHGRDVRITGSFGLLRVGTLEVASISRNGKVDDVCTLGPATPLAACNIDSSFPFEQGSQISLRLRDKGGNLLGTLDNALIS